MKYLLIIICLVLGACAQEQELKCDSSNTVYHVSGVEIDVTKEDYIDSNGDKFFKNPVNNQIYSESEWQVFLNGIPILKIYGRCYKNLNQPPTSSL